MTATKIDLKRELKELYGAKATPAFVDVPALQYLMIDGEGDPNTAAAYRDAIAALYTTAYTLKFTLKRSEAGLDFTVMPLEGLWWAASPTAFHTGDKDAWQWTAMIMMPDFVTAEQVDGVRAAAAHKAPPAAVGRLRLERLHEGRAAQILHLGPYAAEAPTIERLHAFVAENGYELTGKHHEIYLGDPRRTAPEKLKTIIRHPVKPAGG